MVMHNFAKNGGGIKPLPPVPTPMLSIFKTHFPILLSNYCMYKDKHLLYWLLGIRGIIKYFRGIF